MFYLKMHCIPDFFWEQCICFMRFYQNLGLDILDFCNRFSFAIKSKSFNHVFVKEEVCERLLF